MKRNLKNLLCCHLSLILILGNLSSAAWSQVYPSDEKERLSLLHNSMKRSHIPQIDIEIKRALSMGSKGHYRDNFFSMVNLRQKRCPGDRLNCLKTITWEKWACNDSLGNSISAIEKLWSSVIEQVKSEEEATKILNSIYGCSKLVSVRKIAAVLVLFHKVNSEKWVDVEKKIALWLKLILFSKKISYRRHIQALSVIINSLEKIEPVPPPLLMGLVNVNLEALSSFPSERKSSDEYLRVYFRLLLVLTRAGKKAEVYSRINHLIKDSKEKVYFNKKWFGGINNIYCVAAIDTGQLESCRQSIIKYRKGLKPQSKQDLNARSDFYNLLSAEGKLEESIRGLEQVIKDAKKEGELSVLLWTTLRKAFIEAYAGKISKAMASKQRFLNRATLSEKKLLGAYGLILDIWFYRVNRKFAEGWKSVDLAVQLIKKSEPKPSQAMTELYFHTLLLAMAEKNIAKINRYSRLLRIESANDSSQNFYRLIAAIAEKRINNKAIEADMKKLAKARGGGSAPYREFLKVLKSNFKQ